MIQQVQNSFQSFSTLIYVCSMVSGYGPYKLFKGTIDCNGYVWYMALVLAPTTASVDETYQIP
ncbi:hypothetical protein BDA96_04G070700 [Sorghum bicolor]|uniref:Uncharacterized protein n=1 Tax=Sorghum bicolor TaxID=4558 RepID=A0A921R1J9_SORBI|nr:hypothetical protein BDA96_04G070700 [Sorghum bicolor]